MSRMRKTWDGWLRRSDEAASPSPEAPAAVADPPDGDSVSRAVAPAPAARLVDLDDGELQRTLDETKDAATALLERSNVTQEEIDTLTRRMDDLEGEAQRRVQADEKRDALRDRLNRTGNAGGGSVGFRGQPRIDFDSRDPEDALLSYEERIKRALMPLRYEDGNWFADYVNRAHDPGAAQRIADYGAARVRAVQRAGLPVTAALDEEKRLRRAVTGTGEGAVAGNVAATAAGLVQPEYVNDLIATLRRDVSVIAPLVTQRSLTSNVMYVPQITAGVSVAFRAELAVKARSNMTVGTLAASVYSASGVTIISDELADDSNPDAVQLIAQDYAAQQALFVDNTILNGTGSSQPLGVIATSGVNTIAYAGSGSLGANIYALLRQAWTKTYTGGYYGRPDAIIMRPEHAGFLLDALGNSTASLPLMQANNTTGDLSFMGAKIVVTDLLPVDTAATPDDAPIIVGNLKTVVLGMRSGVKFATSEHFAFDQDAITLRSDQRFAVQPARYPKAITVITDVPVA